jgi:outer membrane murein-binding lipoprotein Lpp
MKRTTIIGLILAAVNFAGCSTSESKNEYVDRVNEIQTAVQEAAGALAPASVGTDKEAIKAFDEAEAQVQEAVAELEEIDVPAEAQAGHGELVSAFEDLSELLETVREDVAAGRTVNPGQLAAEGQRIDRDIAKAIDEINADLGAE